MRRPPVLPHGDMRVRPRLGPCAQHPADRVAQDDLPAPIVGEVAVDLHLVATPRQPIGQIARSALLNPDLHVAQPLPARRIQCGPRASPFCVRKPGMMVWKVFLPGARQLAWVGSRLNSCPRFCSAMPLSGSTTPEPKPW